MKLTKLKTTVSIFVRTEELTKMLPVLKTEAYRDWISKHEKENDWFPFVFRIEPVDEDDGYSWEPDYQGLFRLVFTVNYNYKGGCGDTEFFDSFLEYVNDFLEYIEDKTGLKLEVNE